MQGSNSKSIAGFCGLCVAQTEDKPAPPTFRINGIGTTWLGSGSVCPRCTSRIRSHWFTVFWIPLIPLGKFRIIELAERGYIGRKLWDAKKAQPWWFTVMHKLPADSVPLAVVKVHANNTPEQYKEVGKVLSEWKSKTPKVQHIWGLDDLLSGEHPKSPCEYFLIPRSVKDLREGHESVALVMVEPDAAMNDVGNSLVAALGADKSKLAAVSDLDNYCFQQR